MDVSTDSQIDFVINDALAHEPSTSRDNMTDTTPTSVRPVAMGLIDGAPTMGSYDDTSAAGFGGPSAMDPASGDGGRPTTTFGGPPAVSFVVDGGGYPTTAAGGPLSAMGATGGTPATDVVNGNPAPATGGFAPVTSFGDGHLVTITGANPPGPGIAGGPPAASGTTMPTAPCFPLGIAAGDGDLMPPRFSGDRRVDADDWVQDLLDYVAIRRIPPTDAALLLRTRLTGAARTWLESVPPGTTFDDAIARFRKRFGASDQCKPELMTEFWERRQAPDEPAALYIEEKARLARRMRIDSQPFVLHGIIQGLRADVRRDVMLQKPTTLEALNEAAAIADASAKAAAVQSRSDEAAISAQMAEMRAMMATMQVLMINNQQRPVADASTAETSTPRPPPTTVTWQPRPTSTTTAGPSHYQPSGVAAAATAMTQPPATPGQRLLTVQLVMPDGGIATRGGRVGRGRGRGWRGPGRDGHPGWQSRMPAGQAGPNTTGMQHPPAPAPAYQPTPTPDNAATSCLCCGLIHNNGNCRAAFAICYGCQSPGHYFRCCPGRLNPNPQH